MVLVHVEKTSFSVSMALGDPVGAWVRRLSAFD